MRPLSYRSVGAQVRHWLMALVTIGCASAKGSEQTSAFGAARLGLVDAEPDTRHKSVFLLLDEDNGCSASLIAPNLLLTARHCVSARRSGSVACGLTSLGALSSVESMQANNPDDLVAALIAGEDWYAPVEIHVPPEGSDACGFDIAFVVLGVNVPDARATPARPRFDRAARRGEPYTAVGYGLDEAEGSGRRLAREGLTVQCDAGDCRAATSEFSGDGGACAGDSGGPALDANDEIIGVLARGAADCSTAIYTSVSAFRELGLRVAVHAAERGGYDPPDWLRDALDLAPLIAPPGNPDAPSPDAGGADAGGAQLAPVALDAEEPDRAKGCSLRGGSAPSSSVPASLLALALACARRRAARRERASKLPPEL